MRLVLTLSLWLVVTPTLLAQLSTVKRLEFPAYENTEEEHRLVPLGKDGAILLHHTQREMARQPHAFRFVRLDTNLAVRWTANYLIPEKMVPFLSFVNDQYVFYLSAETNSDKFSIVRISLDDGLIDTYPGTLPNALAVSEFRVMGNRAYLAGYNRSRPVVLAFSFFDSSIRLFQGLFLKNVEIGSIDVDEFRQEIHLVTHTMTKRCQFTLRSYSPDGKPLREIDYGGSEYSLISGKLLPVSTDESLLVGNYSTDCTPYSQGIFVTRVVHDQTGKQTITTNRGAGIRYVDFSGLRNFFNYLRPRKQERLKARVEEKKLAGKEYKFRYRLLVHDLMPTPNGLRLVAEVYYPQYRGASSPYITGTWRNAPYLGLQRSRLQSVPFYSSRSMVDRYTEGYRFTHAFICEFDKQGNLLWDNSLTINELNADNVTPMVQVLPQGDRLMLAWEQESTIRPTVIRRDSVLFTADPVKLEAGSSQEKVQQADDESLLAWHGPYFLATGYQRLVADRGHSTPGRDVFYINMIRADAFNVPDTTGTIKQPKPGKQP